MTRAGVLKPLFQLVVFTFAIGPAAALTQESGGTVSVSDITLSRDTVEIGDLIDLSLVIDLAPGTIVFLPDSLDTSDFESFGRVQWTADSLASDRVRLAVTYPLIAFQVGRIEVPEFPIFAARKREAANAQFAEEGDHVGRWSSFRNAPSETPSARMLMIPEQSLWVTSILDLEDASNGVRPQPLADVVGGARHWPATILLVLFGTLFTWVLATSGNKLWEAYRNRPTPPVDPRLAALNAFDALLEEGLHRDGDVRGFYNRASNITRRFIEVFDQRWGPAHTSTELMSDLETAAVLPRFAKIAAVENLTEVMEHAEEVKFGGERPPADEAERDVSAVRAWVEETESP